MARKRIETKMLDDFTESPKKTLPRYDELRGELRKWLESQERWESISALARDLGMNDRTVGHYFEGCRFPTGERRLRLYQVTGLECLREGAIPKRSEAYEMAEKTRDLLFQLVTQLEYFGKTRQRRSVFRSVVPSKDVGFVTSFLKALYDEKSFLVWSAVDRLKERRD